jgi:hypothetical protein
LDELASPHHSEASSLEDASLLTKLRNRIIKYLAISGSAVGGAWLFNKMIHGRDCKDS